jgi:DNA-directed RNA polymerase subunit beta'
MIKELPNPSKISLLLDIPYKEVEQVVYFVNYIILDDNGNQNFKTKDVIDLNNVRSSKANRIKLRKILMNDIMKKLDKNSFDYGRASDYAARLQDSSLPFSIEEVFNFITKYAGIKFGIGAEAIQTLLRQLDLQSELNYVQKQLKKTDPNKVEFRKLIRRVETIK